MVESSIKAELKCGDRVRITTGPFSGLEGNLVRTKNHSKIVLSVEMLGRSVAVEVDARMVERVYESKP